MHQRSAGRRHIGGTSSTSVGTAIRLAQSSAEYPTLLLLLRVATAAAVVGGEKKDKWGNRRRIAEDKGEPLRIRGARRLAACGSVDHSHLQSGRLRVGAATAVRRAMTFHFDGDLATAGSHDLHDEASPFDVALQFSFSRLWRLAFFVSSHRPISQPANLPLSPSAARRLSLHMLHRCTRTFAPTLRLRPIRSPLAPLHFAPARNLSLLCPPPSRQPQHHQQPHLSRPFPRAPLLSHRGMSSGVPAAYAPPALLPPALHDGRSALQLYPALVESAARSPASFPFGRFSLPGACVFFATALSYASVNQSPIMAGHVLIMPRSNISRVRDLPPDQLADLWLTAQHVGRVLEDRFGAEALTLGTEAGTAGERGREGEGEGRVPAAISTFAKSRPQRAAGPSR